MKQQFLVFLLFLASYAAKAQFADNFSDGDFYNNPTWIGDTASFKVNPSNELQLNASKAGKASLFVPTPVPDSFIFETYVRMDFAPSVSNFTRIYLQLSDTAFSKASGYFLEIGENGNADAIKLFRLDTGKTQLLTKCLPGTMANQPAVARIRIIRNGKGVWQLFTDYTGGLAYQIDSMAQDVRYKGGANWYAGVYCEFTDTRKDKFYFDDFKLTDLSKGLDQTPPELKKISVPSATQIQMQFNEPLLKDTVLNTGNFSINKGIGNPTSVEFDPVEVNTINIVLGTPLVNLDTYSIRIVNMTDLAGNKAAPILRNITLTDISIPQSFDILINEIMADPTPVVGLPDAEYLELYNRTDKVFDLGGLVLTVGATSKRLNSQLLLPKSYLILCDATDVAELSALGNTTGIVSFPTLTNTGALVTLADTAKRIIHQVGYQLDWYKDNVKSNGGWSLELINPNKICQPGGNNWSASMANKGGTPGSINSLYDGNPDILPIQAVAVLQNNDGTLSIPFNRTLDAASAANASNYQIDKGIGQPAKAVLKAPDTVLLTLSKQLTGDDTFQLTLGNIFNCTNSQVIQNQTLKFSLPRPFIRSLKITDSISIVLEASDSLDPASIGKLSNYQLSGGLAVINASVHVSNKTMATLQLNAPFSVGASYQIVISGVKNARLTTSDIYTANLIYFKAKPLKAFDLLITEIMADPTPPVGLPPIEYLEIYNNSSEFIDLEGFTIKLGTSTYTLGNHLVRPGGYATVHQAKPGIDFSPFGDTVNINKTLTLPNDDGDLSILSREGFLIDRVLYSSNWYRDSKKAAGGWSLERISNKILCDDNVNWIASSNLLGGTPGKQNAQYQSVAQNPPALLYAFATSPSTIEVRFNQWMSSGWNPADVFLSDGIDVAGLSFSSDGKTWQISAATPLMPGKEYTLTIAHAYNCSGLDVTNRPIQIKIALASSPAPRDIVINELLFNPKTGGADYLELYNRSNKVLNIKDLKIGNLTAGQNIIAIENSYLLFPGQYVVLTDNPEDILSKYKVEQPNALVKNDLPTLDDSRGNISLLFPQLVSAIIIDSFNYDQNMHNPLINNREGVSLERINPDLPTSERANWQSAAATAGFGTPTYRNSQYLNPAANPSDNWLLMENQTFSPDGDGYKDYLLLKYVLEKSGFAGTVKIFDIQGHVVKTVSSNELLSTEGFWQWEGDRDDGLRASLGIYVVLIDLHHSDGTIRKLKKECVLAGKLD